MLRRVEASANIPPPPDLRVTRRCIVEDLGIKLGDATPPTDELAGVHPIVKAFRDRRSQSPIGQEVVTELTTRAVVYTLHSGRERGATWFDEGNGAVWLLASRFHRSGDKDDSYPYFRALDASERLFPTPDDFLALAEFRAGTFAQRLIEDAEGLIQSAKASPDVIHTGSIAGRVRIRLVFESDGPMITVAISRRLLPGALETPPDWLFRVAAAFFPNVSAEELAWTDDLAGQPIFQDEVAFCDFVEQDDP
jgi:hypothetical protein